MNTSVAAGLSSATSRSNEPSMEEILASIRKIIADDQKVLEGKAAPAVSSPAVDLPAEDEDVLELGAPAPQSVIEPPVEVAPPPAPEPQPVAAAPVIAAPVVAVPPAPVAPPVVQPAPEPAPRLMSETSAATAASAFQSLAHTVLNQNARTLDDLVKEMLRPMLKGWLDENLPTLVERLVKAEIERVARGGR